MKAKTKTRKTRAKSPAAAGVVERIKNEAFKLAEQWKGIFPAAPQDIVAAIEEDHKGLRNYLSILKDTGKDMTERRRAYAAFSALLKSHSKAEQTAVYVPTLKLPGHEMHIKVAEGYVEHFLADELMKKMARTKDALMWSAHANVLAETTEHHLKEEERDLLPLVRKTAPPEQNAQMLKKFVQLRKGSQKRVSKKNAGVLQSA